jgi:hypothetical protein
MIELGMFFIQVAASMQKDIDAHVPSYPNLPSKLICLLHSVTLHVIYSYSIMCPPYMNLVITNSYIYHLFFIIRLTQRLMRFMHG